MQSLLALNSLGSPGWSPTPSDLPASASHVSEPCLYKRVVHQIQTLGERGFPRVRSTTQAHSGCPGNVTLKSPLRSKPRQPIQGKELKGTEFLGTQGQGADPPAHPSPHVQGGGSRGRRDLALLSCSEAQPKTPQARLGVTPASSSGKYFLLLGRTHTLPGQEQVSHHLSCPGPSGLWLRHPCPTTRSELLCCLC